MAKFFSSPDRFRKWLEAHHADTAELWVGFYKKGSGKPSITWPESVDQALCFGWIDGLRRSVDEVSYQIRFTPRRATSIWSNINIGRVEALTAAGLMRPAGLAVFGKRDAKKSGIYSFERDKAQSLPKPLEKQLRSNDEAWAFFTAQAPWYQRTAKYWVMNAKREETRMKRLATLIDDSAQARTIAPLTRRPRTK
ncbi:MAG: hypothetical protein JWN44_1005 [Myxococcales bacterium]|nr:hypothetical protein [Myxococcales bacterium]